MAVTINTIFTGTDTLIIEVVATADADVTATVPHSLGAVPQEVYLVPLQDPAALCLWRVTSIGLTNITANKSTTAGSGSASPTARMIIKRPHSIGR